MDVRSASSLRRDNLRFIGPFLSPGRNLSERLRDVSGIRRNPPQHIGPPQSSSWNPSASFRPGSKLRRAYHRTIDLHRSPLEQSIKRLANVRTPKRPSEGRRPDFKLWVENITELQNHLQAPRNLSATHRLESELQKARHHSSGLCQGPEEPVNKPSEDSELPKTRQRTPDLLQESEETFSKALSRFRVLRERFSKLLALVRTPKSPSKNCPLTSKLSESTSTVMWKPRDSEKPIRNHRPASELLMNWSANVWPKSRFRRTRLMAIYLLLGSQNLVKKHPTQIEVPRNLSRSHRPENAILKLVLSRLGNLINSRGSWSEYNQRNSEL